MLYENANKLLTKNRLIEILKSKNRTKVNILMFSKKIPVTLQSKFQICGSVPSLLGFSLEYQKNFRRSYF